MTSWTTPVLAVAAKDLRLLARDRGGFVFTFMFPVALAILMGFMFSGGEQSNDLELAVYDEGGGAEGSASGRFVAGLTAPGEGLLAHRATDRAACEARVRARDSLACLVLPADFQGGLEAMLAGRPLTIELIVDPSRRAEAGLLTGKLMASGYRQLAGSMGDPTQMTGLLARTRARVAADPGVPPVMRAALGQLYSGLDAMSLANVETEPEPRDGSGPGDWAPLKVVTHELTRKRAKGPPSAFAVTFPQGVVWGLMSCVMAFISALIRERSRGTMLRLTAAPIAASQVLAGKSLACFAACVAVQVLILVVGWLGFAVTVGSPALMAVAVICASLGFTGLTLLMAGASRSEEGADGLGRAALMVLALIGGGALPLAFMPAGMLAVSHISPFKWALLAFEGALWRGFTAQEMLLPCAILLAIGVLGFVGGTTMLRRMRVE